MNFNANQGGKPAFGRKIKRVSDVNSMGYNPFETNNAQNQQNFAQSPQNYVQQPQQNFTQQNFAQQPQQGFSQQPQQGFSQQQQPNYSYNETAYPNVNAMSPMAPLSPPTIMQDMAMQYGQQFVGAGTAALKSEVEKLVPVSKLKYYFAVDTKYVMSKMMLLFFPFKHKDWSVKYEGPLQPRFEINAPDLYIPIMAYITYVVVAGAGLGLQQRFGPEQLSTLASSALAWCLAELAVYSCTLYVMDTKLSTLDLVAYSGYKFVGIIVGILTGLVAGRTGYYAALAYMNLALIFFLVRSLRAHVMGDSAQPNSYYGAQMHTGGYKRRAYFLLFAAGLQPLLSWWLSFHLLPVQAAADAASSGAL